MKRQILLTSSLIAAGVGYGESEPRGSAQSSIYAFDFASDTETHSNILPVTIDSQDYTAVYYQPRLSDLHDPASTEVPDGVYVMTAEPEQPDSWTIGECQPDNSDNFLDHEEIDTIVGFSLGRIGVAYFFTSTTPEQQASIDTAVIVAPGNQYDFTGSCDPLDAVESVSHWLAARPDNTFMILADARTAENDHEGIRRMYLDAFATTAVSSQVVVCDVTASGHEESWNDVKDEVFEEIDSCPDGTVAYDAWRQAAAKVLLSTQK